MDAEILAVGTELLMGQIANTNAQYISRRLSDVGVNVYFHSVVGDNPKRLEECLKLALGRSDVVIMTGGLGPTQDDLTKETTAGVLNRKLVLHQESLEKIETFFKKLNRKMSQNNVKQAYMPENSTIMRNDNGTAPGCIIEEGGKTVIMLPGPPSEMRPMFEANVIPYFVKRSGYKLESRYVRIFGVGESALEEKIADLIENQSNPTIAPYAKEGEVTLRITARCEKDADAQNLITPVIDEIKKRIGDAVYSVDDSNLEEVAGTLLLETNTSISLAESCTGGLVSEKLTAKPGISRVFKGGVVSYGNEAKMDILGVKPETLERFGAVSRETAIEMAEGMRKLAKTDIALSITGIAGPEGGTPQKPVGLVHIALADGKGVRHKELRLWGSRDRIRNVTSLYVFDMVRRYLLNIG